MSRLSCVAVGKLFFSAFPQIPVLLLRSGLYRSFLAAFLPREYAIYVREKKNSVARFALVSTAPEDCCLANRRLPFTMSPHIFYERYSAAEIFSLTPQPACGVGKGTSKDFSESARIVDETSNKPISRENTGNDNIKTDTSALQLFYQRIRRRRMKINFHSIAAIFLNPARVNCVEFCKSRVVYTVEIASKLYTLKYLNNRKYLSRKR